MMVNAISRQCLTCGRSHFEVLHQNRLAVLDGLDLSTTIGLCSNCGQIQAFRLAPPAIYEKYYQNLSKTDHTQTLTSLDDGRISQAVQICQQFSRPHAMVADIGCGTGSLLSRLETNGFVPVLGIDPGAGAPAQAKLLHGLTVVEQGFIGAGIERLRHISPDTVMLMAVLEHLWDARSNLEQLAQALKPGAVLILEVPAIEGMAPQLGEPLGEFSIEHIQFFSTRTLTRLVEAVGLNVLHTRLIQWPNRFGSSLFAAAQRPLGDIVQAQITDEIALDWSQDHEAMRRYVEHGRSALASCLSLIPDSVPLVVYGAGAHTARLLPLMPSAMKQRILCIVDGNPNLHGKKMGEFTIEAASQLVKHPNAAIVISSYRSQEFLAHSLAKSWPNPIHRLYTDSLNVSDTGPR
jgi:SAM-dependent methyltransferase